MKNISEVVDEEDMEPGALGSVMQKLIDLPIGGGEKVNLLQAWAVSVGAKVSGSQYQRVYVSGDDTTPF